MHELHSAALDFVCHYCDRQFYSLTVWAAIAHVTNTFIHIVKFLLLLLSHWVCSHHIIGKQLNCRRISQNNTWKKSTQKALFLCSISVYFNMAYTIFASNLCLCLMWATLFDVDFFFSWTIILRYRTPCMSAINISAYFLFIVQRINPTINR